MWYVGSGSNLRQGEQIRNRWSDEVPTLWDTLLPVIFDPPIKCLSGPNAGYSFHPSCARRFGFAFWCDFSRARSFIHFPQACSPKFSWTCLPHFAIQIPPKHQSHLKVTRKKLESGHKCHVVFLAFAPISSKMLSELVSVELFMNYRLLHQFSVAFFGESTQKADLNLRMRQLEQATNFAEGTERAVWIIHAVEAVSAPATSTGMVAAGDAIRKFRTLPKDCKKWKGRVFRSDGVLADFLVLRAWLAYPGCNFDSLWRSSEYLDDFLRFLAVLLHHWNLFSESCIERLVHSISED